MSLFSCKQASLYQQLKNIPDAQWKSSYEPSFTFNISDTTATYEVYIIIRHTNNYAYSNVWIKASLQLPGDSLKNQNLDLQLANNENWLGVGMDDIYERIIKITPQPQKFPKPGIVTFNLKQIMRQDSLPGIMQVGMKVEKINGH